MGQRPYSIDPNGRAVRASRIIEDVLEIAITAGGWVAVNVPADIYTKAVYITTRDGADFNLSNESDGDGYATLNSGFGIDLAKKPEENICYVRGTSTTTLEVILLG